MEARAVYTRVVLAAVAAAGLQALVRLFVPAATLHQDVHGVGAYLGVLGGLYSIVVAFLIYVVWDQYNRVQTGVAQEAAALEDVCRVASFAAERDDSRRIRTAVRTYLDSTSGDEARRLAHRESSELAEEHFDAMSQAVRAVGVSTAKDQVIYGELMRALTRVSDARDARLSVSSTRIPGTLWNLVVFGSIALFTGFLALGIHSHLISIGIAASLGGTLVFLLSVVQDMDNPFEGEWNVSYAPMSNTAARLGHK